MMFTNAPGLFLSATSNHKTWSCRAPNYQKNQFLVGENIFEKTCQNNIGQVKNFGKFVRIYIRIFL